MAITPDDLIVPGDVVEVSKGLKLAGRAFVLLSTPFHHVDQWWLVARPAEIPSGEPTLLKASAMTLVSRRAARTLEAIPLSETPR